MITSCQLASVNSLANLALFFVESYKDYPLQLYSIQNVNMSFHKILKRKHLNVSHLRREFKMPHSKNAAMVWQKSKHFSCTYLVSNDIQSCNLLLFGVFRFWIASVICIYLLFSRFAVEKSKDPLLMLLLIWFIVGNNSVFVWESFLNCNNTIFT